MGRESRATLVTLLLLMVLWEVVGRYDLDRRPLAAVALTTNTAALTAIANDYGFD